VGEVLQRSQESAAVADIKERSDQLETRGEGEGTTVHRILVVEDSETMRSLISSSLEDLELPVKISEAASGFEALRVLPREDFDLVVTDINMPDINGLELLSFVRSNKRYQGVPVVIVSTEGSERDRDKGLGLGADAYLVKPFEPEVLRQAVADLLSRPRREDQGD
jgi:two-component system chemotaxis response regulator CheY